MLMQHSMARNAALTGSMERNILPILHEKCNLQIFLADTHTSLCWEGLENFVLRVLDISSSQTLYHAWYMVKVFTTFAMYLAFNFELKLWREVFEMRFLWFPFLYHAWYMVKVFTTFAMYLAFNFELKLWRKVFENRFQYGFPLEYYTAENFGLTHLANTWLFISCHGAILY